MKWDRKDNIQRRHFDINHLDLLYELDFRFCFTIAINFLKGTRLHEFNFTGPEINICLFKINAIIVTTLQNRITMDF